MQTEVLALFQKELKEEIRLIETLLPDFGDARVQHELSRIFHSMKGAASLLKIDSIRKASAFFEKRMNDDVIFDAERLKKGIMHFVDHLKEIAECKEGQFIQTIKEKESDFDQLEKMFAVSCDISLPNGEATTATLKEIMIRFKQHLNYCETHFDDLARLALLEEISTELKEFGRQNHIPIVQEAGKALSLCFFAARKKLLGWTRGHFDLITEIVEFLSSVSTQTQEERTQWIEYSKKNVETCIGIISALASEAIQFVQNDLGEDSMTVVPIELKAEPILHREEQDLRFLGL